MGLRSFFVKIQSALLGVGVFHFLFGRIRVARRVFWLERVPLGSSTLLLQYSVQTQLKISQTETCQCRKEESEEREREWETEKCKRTRSNWHQLVIRNRRFADKKTPCVSWMFIITMVRSLFIRRIWIS